MLATSSASLGTNNLLLVACGMAAVGSQVALGAEAHMVGSSKDSGDGKAGGSWEWRGVLGELVEDFQRTTRTVLEIWDQGLLRSAFLYAVFYSSVMGLNLMEKRSAARRSGLSRESYTSSMGTNQICIFLAYP